MKIKPYTHIIEIDEARRKIMISRLRKNYHELYTEREVEDIDWKNNEDRFREFCRILGEDILLDSPSGRALFGL